MGKETMLLTLNQLLMAMELVERSHRWNQSMECRYSGGG
jgi:hypothetical protein